MTLEVILPSSPQFKVSIESKNVDDKCVKVLKVGGKVISQVPDLKSRCPVAIVETYISKR